MRFEYASSSIEIFLKFLRIARSRQRKHQQHAGFLSAQIIRQDTADLLSLDVAGIQRDHPARVDARAEDDGNAAAPDFLNRVERAGRDVPQAKPLDNEPVELALLEQQRDDPAVGA